MTKNPTKHYKKSQKERQNRVHARTIIPPTYEVRPHVQLDGWLLPQMVMHPSENEHLGSLSG